MDTQFDNELNCLKIDQTKYVSLKFRVNSYERSHKPLSKIMYVLPIELISDIQYITVYLTSTREFMSDFSLAIFLRYIFIDSCKYKEFIHQWKCKYINRSVHFTRKYIAIYTCRTVIFVVGILIICKFSMLSCA